MEEGMIATDNNFIACYVSYEFNAIVGLADISTGETCVMMIDKTSMAIESTQSLVYLFYQHSFTVNDKGYGSAIIMLLLAIIMVITFIQSKIEKKWVHY